MDRKALEARSLGFARDVARYCDAVRRSSIVHHAAQQLLRASSSMAANYRASGRARSRREFVSKLGIVNEEADESVFWLEYMTHERHELGDEHERLMTESQELRRIFAAAYATARRNLR